jgi:hypothetical protein
MLDSQDMPASQARSIVSPPCAPRLGSLALLLLRR